MKQALLLLLLVSSGIANGQSLKEALFGGKLKNEAGTVIRKGDDLASKMDTARKAPVEEAPKIAAAAPANTSTENGAAPADSAVAVTTGNETADSGAVDTAATAPADVPATPAPKDNNGLWKAYMTTVANTLNAEVLTSKKVKRGTYYVTVSYSIETDGQANVTDVFVAPENKFMQQQIKDRLASDDVPKLNPVLSSSGAARKVNRKYNFTLTKE
jgi:hypothetical protein